MTLLLILITLIALHGDKCRSYNLSDLPNYPAIRRLLKEWSNQTSHASKLTIVFDNYSKGTIDIPVKLFEELYTTTKLITVDHLMRLDSRKKSLDFHVIETGVCVLLVSPNILNVRPILLSQHLLSFWQPENFYILWEARADPPSIYDRRYQRFLEWALERLWRFRRIYKIVLCIGDKFISYDPFKYENHYGIYVKVQACKRNCNRYVRKSYSILTVMNSSTADVSRYVAESPDTFDLYPLKISVFEATTMIKTGNTYTGVDMRFAMEICRMMNVTPIFMENKLAFGWKQNGKFYGALGDIVYKRADVTFNEFFMKSYSSRHIDVLVPITDDDLCLLVPRAKPVPAYLIIPKVFTPTSWIVILLGYVVISTIYSIVRPAAGEMSYEREEEVFDVLPEEKEEGVEEKGIRAKLAGTRSQCTRQDCAVTFLPRVNEEKKENGSMCLDEKNPELLGVEGGERSSGGSYCDRSKRLKTICQKELASLCKYFIKVILQIGEPFQAASPRFSERLLVIFSLAMSIILNGIFTSSLTSRFSKVAHYPDVRTLKEIDEQGFDVITPSRNLIEDTFDDLDNPVTRSLRAKLRYEPIDKAFSRLFEGQHVALLQRKATIPLKFTKSQRESMHVVEECPKLYLSGHLASKGSPFYTRMNEIVGRLNNGGFYDKWFEDMTWTLRSEEDEETAPEIRSSLNMKHFSIPFVILFIGLSLSTIVFVYERRQNNSKGVSRISASIKRYPAGK